MQAHPEHPQWLLPQWPAPARVRALCSTRLGGSSVGAFASLNLGDHVGDAAAAVAHNRQLLRQTMDGARPVFLHQVHGQHTLNLRPDSQDGQAADAAFTGTAGLACTVMVADCLPILLCDRQGQVVAAAHAGWRGLAGATQGGIVEAVVGDLRRLTGQPEGLAVRDLMAWLGPCIGPAAFEVGDEVRAAFVAHNAEAASCFVAQGDKWLADLPALARQRLRAQGVIEVYGNDGSPAWCTLGNPARFFSHRRDRLSGRQAAGIWLE
ncbi:MAG: peptidoglycan editing factor PgeF [Rhodoferax sp.]